MKNIISFCFFLLIAVTLTAQEKPISAAQFNIINLDYKGLESVKNLVNSKKYEEAGKELLKYYRTRTNVKLGEFKMGDSERFRGKSLSIDDQEKADNALLHNFKPHKGYGFFNYGEDINWQNWPVKDNEVRWQLHRLGWFTPMGLAYRASGDEKYAKEWVHQYRDWVKKNPKGLSADNDKYVWRPLEVSERINMLRGVFNLMGTSKAFTPSFLLEFLQSYGEQTDYLIKNYADKGNHRLFEAQRALAAGCFFPELKNAESWRKSGAQVLVVEIKKQVLDDGMQFELSPNYHNTMINIFLEGLKSAKDAGLESEFPTSYKETVEKMAMATVNFSFPDYNFPMFGDAWPVGKPTMLKQYKTWANAFPDNSTLQYFATDGVEGKVPGYLSKGLNSAGFYTFRNGWDMKSTVMVLKASPPGEFHAQPDNGTFELWVKGRDFTPDAGVFVYSGDEEVNKMREEFRQTKFHSTLTLDDQNMVITKAKQNKWVTDKMMDILTYTNPSYADLNHQRSILFIDQKYFLIIDNAIGKATGKLDVRFHLKEDAEPVYDVTKNLVYTTYADGNNLLIQSLNKDKVKLIKEQSKVSYFYRKEQKRPAVAFEKQKNDGQTQSFIHILYPFNDKKAPQISVKENPGNNYASGTINLTLTIDGKVKNVVSNLVN
ncbi:heparinase II/III family protein [Pedobacter sp. MC2016-05]|uniref:heparin-sulfate lyase HepC n=1 Tax=Pedobacter sp. MC2016-05 TaxID=2994474 RepID=UPI0022459220|nr:heparin-sulfate lyase HepC [Pedobacter sp. MC2016-05]MCX2477013.1 heparinase II/III family protein [Pedobacter sp. MC2016-05]